MCFVSEATGSAIVLSAEALQQHLGAVLENAFHPTMDGLETLRRIRAIEAGQQKEESQAVYMVTAFADNETKSMAAEHGADGFLAKPFSPREMLEVMRIVSTS